MGWSLSFKGAQSGYPAVYHAAACLRSLVGLKLAHLTGLRVAYAQIAHEIRSQQRFAVYVDRAHPEYPILPFR